MRQNVGTFEDQRSNLTLGGCIKIDKESFTHPRCPHSVLRVPGQLKMANPDYQGLAEYAAGLCDSEILCSISIPIATALNLQYQYRYKCLLASPFNSNIDINTCWLYFAITISITISAISMPVSVAFVHPCDFNLNIGILCQYLRSQYHYLDPLFLLAV